MRSLSFGPAPRAATTEQKIDWIFNCLITIQNASNETDASRVADGFTYTNRTADRIIDCDSTTAAEIADYLCTFIDDLKKRGQKGTSTAG